MPENYGVEDLDTLAAASNLTGKETFLGTINSSGLADLAAGATRPLFVIVQGAPQGRAVSCLHGGVGRVVAGNTVAIGDKITSNGSGQGIATTTTGNFIVGWARSGAASGQVFDCRVEPGVL